MPVYAKDELVVLKPYCERAKIMQRKLRGKPPYKVVEHIPEALPGPGDIIAHMAGGTDARIPGAVIILVNGKEERIAEDLVDKYYPPTVFTGVKG